MSVAEHITARIAELRTEIARTTAQLEDINQREAAFRREHTALVNGSLMFRAKPEMAAGLRENLMRFQRERHTLSNRMHVLLGEHADLKYRRED